MTWSPVSAAVRLLTRSHTVSSRTAPHFEGRLEEKETLFPVVMPMAARYVVVRVCAQIHDPAMVPCIVSLMFKIACDMSGRLHKGKERSCSSGIYGN